MDLLFTMVLAYVAFKFMLLLLLDNCIQVCVCMCACIDGWGIIHGP